MGKLILTALIVVLVAHSLAFIGFLGYGAIAGRFDYQKRQQYLATWRGEKLVPPPPEVTVKLKQDSPREASSKILAVQLEREILSRELQLYEKQLNDKEITIAAAQAKLEKDIKKLQDEQDEFAYLVDQHNKKNQEEGFRKDLKIYSGMKAKLVKEDFMKMDDGDVVRYLADMKADKATEILNQFKTPEEQDKRIRLMKLLEQYGVIDPKENNKLLTKN